MIGLWNTHHVKISAAGNEDVAHLARLIWIDSRGEEPSRQDLGAFASEVESWWSTREDSHLAFVARLDELQPVGMAWVALLSRTPRPGATDRICADVQTVFVMPEHRGQGIASALVKAATDHALTSGCVRVTVHSGRRAVPMYERLGFVSSRQLLQRLPD